MLDDRSTGIDFNTGTDLSQTSHNRDAIGGLRKKEVIGIKSVAIISHHFKSCPVKRRFLSDSQVNIQQSGWQKASGFGIHHDGRTGHIDSKSLNKLAVVIEIIDHGTIVHLRDGGCDGGRITRPGTHV